MAGLSITNFILAALAGLMMVLLVWVALLSLSVRRYNRARRQVVKAMKDEKEVIEIIAKSVDDIERLYKRQEETAAAVLEQRAMIGETIKHIGIVRYDAFPEVGGRLSFSAAFLNEAGDGVVVTSINGRSDSRVYAKTVAAGRSAHALSGEEEEAIIEAFKGAKV